MTETGTAGPTVAAVVGSILMARMMECDDLGAPSTVPGHTRKITLGGARSVTSIDASSIVIAASRQQGVQT